MDANELRAAFTRYFTERGHTAVPSASLIPHDPSVLFTIAGMVPFKSYFVGDEPAPWPRATSVQKCFRTLDIEIVGTDTYHCTFFEMLGNFSFGDYFKEEAIPMAWGLLTDVFGLDPDRLWVTVHDSDDEAERIWIEKVGFPAERIQRMGDEDNFWAMDATGPCGPDSEIFYDRGEEYGAEGGPKFGGEERYVEIWNLVFMQYNRGADGTLTELPKKNIDTGAGLERILPILQGRDSVFDTDLFAPIIEAAAATCGVRLRGRGAHRRGAAADGRPRAGHVDAGGRRRAAGQRGPGLRAAPRRPAGGAGGAPSGGRGARDPGARRRGHRRARRGLAGAGRQQRRDPRRARARGGGLRPDAAGRVGPAGGGVRHRREGARRRRGLHPARHPRLPGRADRGAGP